MATPVTQWDATGTPLTAEQPPARTSPTQWDASGNPISESTPSPGFQLTQAQASDAWKASVYSRMMPGIEPGYAYQNVEEIDRQMRERGGADYDTLEYAAKEGFEETSLGMMIRGQAPDPFESHDMLNNFVHDVVANFTDPAFLLPTIAGTLLGAPELGAVAGFALSSATRKGLIDHYEKGDVKSFGELAERAGDVLWAGTKGAAIGEVGALAGGIPVGSLIGKSALASLAVKGLYQSAAMTTAGSILDAQVPRLDDFVRSAGVIVPLNMVLGGLSMSKVSAKRALMDVYAKDGVSPQESAVKLAAQPVVKADLPTGLRPAIKFGDEFLEGNTAESHAELSGRLGSKPVTMEQLEADPTLADKVLQEPQTHEQSVIDKAWELKKAAMESGEPDPESVFHGTPAEFEGVPTTRGLGAHFTPDKGIAKAIAGETGRVLEGKLDLKNPLRVEDIPGSHSEAQSVVENFVKQGVLPDEFLKEVQDGAIYERSQEIVGDIGDLQGKELAKKRNDAYAQANDEVLEKVKSYLKSKGYDGLVYENKVEGGGDSYVAFNGKQFSLRPQTIDQLYNRGEMKSGRGFVTPDGKFLTREQARAWMKENESDVHQMWSDTVGGDKEELHAQPYAEARARVQGRNVAEGEPEYGGMSPELATGLAGLRGELNTIKASDQGSRYGHSLIRSLWDGPRKSLRAEGAQVLGRLKKLIPESQDQEALSFLRDYRDDPQALRAAIEEVRNGSNEKLKAFIPSMERALNPSPEMLRADAELTRYFSNALNLGRQVGTLESSIDPARYNPRMFMEAMDKAEQSPEFGRPKFTEKTPHAIRREHLRLLDPLKSGDMEARTFNALDELGVYTDRHATSIATKIFTTELKNSSLGMEGTAESHPEGWKPLPGSGGLWVPKVVADAMEPLLKGGGTPSQLAKFLHLQSFVKGMELGLSVFHMKALSLTVFNNMGLGDFAKSLHSDNSSPVFEAQERAAALFGVETTKTGPLYESYMGLKGSSIPTGLSKLSNMAVVKQIDALFKATTKGTFDVVQRKFKVMDFSLKQAAWVAKNTGATEAQYSAAMRSIAKEINAAYGGLNWDVMGVSKGMRDVSRMILLAPDWTFSNVLNAKYSFEGGPAGSAARMFWLKSTVTGFAMTAAMSQMIGGKWDMKHPEMVYLGKDKNGKDMYGNWFFAGAPKDAITLINRVMKDGPAGLAEFTVGKVAPIASTVYGLAQNKEYSGKPIYKKTDSFVDKSINQSKFVAKKLLPITIPSVVDAVQTMLTDPNHDYTYKDIIDVVGAMSGSPTYHDADKGGTKLSTSGSLGGKKGPQKQKFSIRQKR